jgi:NAD(P)-dependent dehydrogenase (short-subunit alcohol dehydrogenase family)
MQLVWITGVDRGHGRLTAGTLAKQSQVVLTAIHDRAAGPRRPAQAAPYQRGGE